ncbi:MAG: hypothetical protein BKP49_06345 [Treponema sp. CETP13]|nr:MAG: hypothetical protein BKP49_06345 [Treponema sp. CETP13]
MTTLLVIFLGLFFITIPFYAEPQVPTQTAWVMDTAQVMSETERAQLEQYLVNLDTQTGIQIAVYTVNSLEGYSLEDYSMAVAENWQLGQKNADNGVLVFVAMNERKIRIEVGYGLESSLTDAKSGLIIRKVIAPYFQDGQYSAGIIAGVQTIANVVVGENAGYVDTELATSVPETESAAPSSGFSAIVLILFLILMLVNMSHRGAKSGKYKRDSTGRVIKDIIWLNILYSMFGPRGPRGGGGLGSGGGSSSFGGFSGGGGGSFGGGGASGGW